MRKLEKLARVVNDCFREYLQKDFKEEFELELETSFSIITMQLHSSRTDGRPLTRTQARWIKVWEAGYLSALWVVRVAANQDSLGRRDWEERGRS